MKARKEASNNIVTYATIGGLGILAVGAAAYYFLTGSKDKDTKTQSTAKGNSVPREETLKILNSLRREMFPFFKKLANQSKGFMEETGQDIPVDELKREILQHGKHEIQAITNRVLAKHNVSESDFQYTCDVTFKDDREIKQKRLAIQDDLEKSLAGKLETKAPVPEFLTSKKTLELSVKMMKATLNKIREAFEEFENQGYEVSLKNPKVLMALQQLKLDDLRTELLNQEGLGGLDDHPEKIMASAVSKYVKIDPTFQAKYERLETENMQTMQKLMHNTMDKSRAVEQFGKGIAEEEDGPPVRFGRTLSSIKQTSKENDEEAPAPILARAHTSVGDPNKNKPDLSSLKRQIMVEYRTALEKSNQFKDNEAFIESALESLLSTMGDLKQETILAQLQGLNENKLVKGDSELFEMIKDVHGHVEHTEPQAHGLDHPQIEETKEKELKKDEQADSHAEPQVLGAVHQEEKPEQHHEHPKATENHEHIHTTEQAHTTEQIHTTEQFHGAEQIHTAEGTQITTHDEHTHTKEEHKPEIAEAQH